jgi:hypothetical protein
MLFGCCGKPIVCFREDEKRQENKNENEDKNQVFGFHKLRFCDFFALCNHKNNKLLQPL